MMGGDADTASAKGGESEEKIPFSQHSATTPLSANDYYQTPEGRWRPKEAPNLSTNGAHADDADDGEDRSETLKPFPDTDAGNGEVFARQHGARVRFDHRRQRWLTRAAHWWAPDADGEVHRLAKATARQRGLDALTTIEDLEKRAKAVKFAIASESRQRIDAMLAAARSEPPIADTGEAWDSDPFLFAASNGVVQLREGTLRDGLPEDRITLHSDVAFDPEAKCPRWLQFLDEVFKGDVDLIDFIQRATGYSLTGDTREQVIFLLYGWGQNGKSVFQSTVRSLAGSYSYNAPFSTFEMERQASIPNDVAALAGKRIVTSSETNEGTRFNEARLKALTGGDPVTARFLHAEYFSFVPVAKLWLATNHRPIVTDDSIGFWRRVRLIPFTRVFTDNEVDKGLVEVLRGELRGILAWAVRGALEWQRRGLAAPKAVLLATESYRTDSDPLALFLEECCIQGADHHVSASTAYKCYVAWAAGQGLSERERLSNTKFGTRMSSRFEKVKGNTGRIYHGVGLITERGPNSDGLVKGLEAKGPENDLPPTNVLLGKNLEKGLNPSHPSPNGLASDAERDLCLGSARTLDFPEIELGPGVKVTLGEASWVRFVGRNDADTVEAAQVALDQMGEGAP